MKSLEEEFNEFADDVKHLCNHISVREDENGPYIFALGLKNTHTLQLRKIMNKYVVELWHGENSEVESVVEEPSYPNVESAFIKAKEWLERDAI